MKRFSFANLLIFALAGTIALTGCKHPTQPVTDIPNLEPPMVTSPQPSDKDLFPRPQPRPRPVEPAPPVITDTTGEGKDLPKAGPNDPAHLAGNYDPNTWTTDATIFQGDTVYFEFDRSTVKDSEKSKIQAVADYFKDPKNAANHVTIEGHCDERGTEGYNLALGERRALALREQLIQLGVGADKIHTISYGLARPAVLGHNEAAWSKNRRGAFDLVSPPAGQ